MRSSPTPLSWTTSPGCGDAFEMASRTIVSGNAVAVDPLGEAARGARSAARVAAAAAAAEQEGTAQGHGQRGAREKRRATHGRALRAGQPRVDPLRA